MLCVMLQNRIIHGEIQRKYGWKVNKFVIYRGLMLVGDQSEEYVKDKDYAFTLLKRNPGSIVVVHVDFILISLRPKLERLYIYLEVC